MLLDPDNPRSLTFQLDRLVDDLASLPHEDGRRVSEAEKPALEASTAPPPGRHREAGINVEKW